MEDLDTLIDYFKKLQKSINCDADFDFFGTKLIKKHKIDDLLCCILATLPDSYKHLMRTKEGKKRNSILCYDIMFNAIKNKFVFNSNVYVVNSAKAIKMIDNIIIHIKKDIQFAEKHAE